MNIEAVVGFIGQRIAAAISAPLASFGVATNNSEALVVAATLVALDIARAFFKWKRG